MVGKSNTNSVKKKSLKNNYIYKLAMAAVLIAAIATFILWRGKEGFVEKTFFIMGTMVNITLPKSEEGEFKNIAQLMKSFSDNVSHDTYEISNKSGIVSVSPLTCQLLKNSIMYESISGGRFNPAVATITALYGFPEGPYRSPDLHAINEAKKSIAEKQIILEEKGGICYASGNGLKVDLGAFAKGSIVDKGVEYLRSRGIKDFIVNGGGDLYAGGTKAGVFWNLGISDPNNPQEPIEVIKLKDKALATSGTYERYFTDENGRRVSHLFDGVTGNPADKYVSLSVIGESVEEADAFSTVYFFMDKGEIEAACKKYNTPVLLITTDGYKIPLCGWDKYR